VSLFTKVLIADSLELLSHHFEDECPGIVQTCTNITYFCFEGQFYKQTDRVAMGSPLSPVITNFFMEDFEKKALEQVAYKPVCWFQYVDDTFIVASWQSKTDRISEAF
jgi:hypothetical protein